MESRSNLLKGNTGTITNVTGNTTQNQTQVQTQTSSGSSSTRGFDSVTESRISDYLDPASRKALNQLIKSLQGGTSEAGKFDKERLDEISTNQSLRSDYTKANAFADALAAMNSNLARGIESQMPTITAGIDAAGTSGSAMSALLTQQAAENAARNAAELGLQAAVNYGQIQVGFGDILERLSQGGSAVTNSLLDALGIAKGSYENTKSTSNRNYGESGSSSSTTTGITNTTTNTAEDKIIKETPNTRTPTGGSVGFQFQKFPDLSSPPRLGSTTKGTTGYTNAFGF